MPAAVAWLLTWGRHALIVLVLAATAKAQLPPLATANALGSQIYAATDSTGMVLVVVRDNDIYMQSYGETSPGNGQRPDAHSFIRLCSLSKIIATDLLARLVTDHTVNFTDTLQHFAPAETHVPTETIHGPAGRAITLGDLATHTAGLPREVGPAPRDTPHFTFPDYDYRWGWLPRQKLITDPGTAASYSNIGFDLLGDALVAATGKPYATLFAERIAIPLGLQETTLTPTSEQCSHLMIGSHHEGPCTDTHASAASGGMYSTAADMTLWLKYLLGLPGVPVHQNPAAQAVYILPNQLKSMKGMDHAGDPSGIGLGWIRVGDPSDPGMIIEKTGGGGGFSTYIALNPARHAGVFLAATDGPHFTHTHMFQQVNNLLLTVSGLPTLPLPVEPETKPVHQERTPVHPRTVRSASAHAAATRRAATHTKAQPTPRHRGRASRRPPSR